MLQSAGIPSSVQSAYESYSQSCRAIGERPLRLPDLLMLAALIQAEDSKLSRTANSH